MARPKGFEPLTHALEVSNALYLVSVIILRVYRLILHLLPIC